MRNILIYTTALLAILSCIKDDPTDGAPSDVITIAPYVPQTKVAGYINTNADFAGSKMVVYDYIQAPGTEQNPNGVHGWYMDGVELACDADGNWNYISTDTTEPKFLWIDNSTNTFFGWLDMNGSWYYDEDKLPSFSTENRQLTIPTITFTKDSPVYDFMYSEVVEIDYEKNPADGRIPITEVPLQMKHLFTAFAFGVSNSTNSNVVVKEFSINGLCSTNSAVVDFDFNSATATVTYGAGKRSDGIYVQKGEADITLGAGERYADVFNTSAKSPQYMIMWPHNGTGNQWLHSTEEIETNPETGVMTYPDEYLMFVRYTMDGAEFEKRINFPPGTIWEAGKRYHYNIEFADKIIKLTCTVNPWNGNDLDINFEDSTVSMKEGEQLRWDTSKSNVVDNNVYITNNTPAEGLFHFDTPVGGNWYASLSGDVDAFILEPNTGAINETSSKIRVVPVYTGDRDRDYRVTINFFVRRADGRTIPADDEIQPTPFTIIHQSN